MAKILNQKLLSEMFKAYSENPSVSYIAKRFNKSWHTVNRCKFTEEWDKRMAEIRDKVKEKENYDIEKSMEENIKIVRTVKSYLIQLLTEFISLMKVGESSMTDHQRQRLTYLKKQLRLSTIDSAFDRLIRLESFVMGGPDARSEESQELTVEQAVHLLDERDRQKKLEAEQEAAKASENEMKERGKQ